jgi:HKD family nuclease/predicted CopG family antitoxin
MSYFLRNTQDDSLSRIINNLLPSKTKSMDFLVGYFYFSGLEEIYKNIEDKPMRILVGMDMDHDIIKKTAEFDLHVSNRIPSNKELREEFYNSLIQMFNETGYFESTKQEKAFKIYYEKIKDGTLEIRKTREKCHAKMYIFAYKDELTEGGATPGTVITGSSNFTYSGFQSNNEINVRFQGKEEFADAEQIFKELWDSATVLVDKDTIVDFENGVMKHIWYEQTPTPYLLYLRVLYEYFHLDTTEQILTPYEITDGEFLNLKYQEDAVRFRLCIA